MQDDPLMENNFKKAFAAGLAAASMNVAQAHHTNPAPKQPVSARKISGNSSYSAFDAYIQDLIRHEGSIEYQRAKGMYRNGLFFPYKDSKGYLTVGYGHKVLPGENFHQGITEEQALSILRKDSFKAWQEAIQLLKEHNVELAQDQRESVMRILPNMCFQLGKHGVRDFKNMWKALQAGDFKEASKEMLDSKWARSDSPNRARELASKMKVIAP